VLEGVGGNAPKGTGPGLVAFADQVDRGRGPQGEVSDREVGGLVDPRARVVEEEQERMIAGPLLGPGAVNLQEGLHLGFVEIGHGRVGGLLERNGAEVGTPSEVGRAVQGDELRERVNGREALIAGPITTSSISLQMLEEPPEQTRG
jgi:hypothetical protein